MATSDFDQVLRNREQRNSLTAEKAKQILQAKEAKGAALLAAYSKVGADIPVDPDAGSWVSKLGWHPDSVPGQVVNLGANLVSGGSRLASNILTSPLDSSSMAMDQGITPESLEAYNRATRGEATDQDLATLKAVDASGISQLDRLRQSAAIRRKSGEIASALDLTSIVHGKHKRAFAEDLAKGFDKPWEQVVDGARSTMEGAVLSGPVDVMSGLGKLAAHAVSSTISNGAGAREYVTENIPQLAVGAFGKLGQAAMAAGNVGYGAENYRKGIEEFQKKNNGALPTSEQLDHMAKMSIAAAAAEHAGDVLGHVNMKALTQEAKAAAKAAKEELRTGFVASLKNIGKATTAGTAEEGVTEGFQTYAENEAMLKETKASDVYVGAVIGGVSGGTMAGGGRTLSEIANATPEQIERRKSDAQKFVDAVKDNDPAVYLDTTSSDYNPNKALSTLFANVKRQDSTLEEREANFATAEKVVMDYYDELDKIAAATPSNKKHFTAQLNAAQADLAKLPEGAPEEDLAALQAKVDQLQKLVDVPLAEGKALVDLTKKRNEMEEAHRQMFDQLAAFQAYNESRASEPTPAPQPSEEVKAEAEPAPAQDTTADLELAKTPVKEDDTEGMQASQEAASRVVIRAMAAPDEFSSDDLDGLANNTSNGLTTQQRNYLQAVSKSKVARGTVEGMGTVSEQVLFGDRSKGQLGAESYRQRMAAAISHGNEAMAERQLQGLKRFADGHKAKADTLEAAYAQVQKTGVNVQMVKNDEGDWEIQPLTLSSEELGDVGGFVVHKNSDKFVERVRMESDALDSTMLELKLAKELKFNPQVEEAVPAVEAPAEVPAANLEVTSEAVTTETGSVQPNPVTEGTAPEVTDQAANTDPAQTFVDALNTDDMFARWSNTQDDRDVLVSQMAGVAKQVLPMAIEEKRGDLAEYLQGFRWFKNNSPENQKAAIDALIAANQVSQTPAPVTATAEEQPASTIPPLEEDPSLAAALPLAQKPEEAAQPANSPGLPTANADQAPAVEKVVLPITGKYTAKDQAKSDQATKFIGQGSTKSSTAKYAVAWGDQANTGEYSAEDTVFVSAEGGRPGRVAPDFVEIGKATAAGATIITDNITDRERGYNVGEREVAQFLESQGYMETAPGQWKPTQPVVPETVEESSTVAQATEVTLNSIKANPTEGGLAAMSAPTKDAEDNPLGYQKVNIVGRYMTQTPQGKVEGTFRPLVAVKDFMTRLKAGQVDLSALLGTKRHNDLINLENAKTRASELDGQDTEKAKDVAREVQSGEKKLNLLHQFDAKRREWTEYFRANLVHKEYIPKAEKGQEPDLTRKSDYHFNDMVQFLLQHGVDQDGKKTIDLEENVLTAMAYSAWSTLVELAQRPEGDNQEMINQVLGRPDDFPISSEEEALFAGAGVRTNTLYGALGRRAVEALGLKLKPDAPLGDLERLQAGLGSHIAKMMEDGPSPLHKGRAVMLERRNISLAEMVEAGVRESTGSAEKDARKVESFLRLKRVEGEPVPEVQAMVEASRGTQSVLDDLFSVESGMLAPSFEPQEFKQSKAKGSRWKVPKAMKKILEMMQTQGSKVRQDNWHLFTAEDANGNPVFSHTMLAEIAGMEKVDELTSNALRKSIEAKNAGLLREISNFINFVHDSVLTRKEGLDSVMYFLHEVWKQQRVGIKTTLINPQASKFHRGMLTRDAWTTTISTDDAKAMRSFRLRVLEGLGVKTDKESNEVSLAKFHAMFTPDLAVDDKQRERAIKLGKAVQAIMARMAGESLTAAQAQDIVEGVAAGGEKMHSLDSLMAMAQWRYAVKNTAQGPAKFTVHITGEVDGVTNGPMLSHILLGAASSVSSLFDRINKGGFFQHKNGPRNYNIYRGSGDRQDLYESTITHLLTKGWEATVSYWGEGSELPDNCMATLKLFYGDLQDSAGKITSVGRNIIKTPLTAFIFGSSPYRAADAMAEDFIAQVYKKFEKAARNGESLRPLVEQLNTMLDRLPLPPTITYEQFQNRAHGKGFSKEQVKNIKQVFHSSFGRALVSTLNSEFKVLSERRDSMNRAAQLAHSFYAAAYASIRQAYIADLIKKEKIKTDVAGNPLHDLTQEQEEGLRKLLQAIEPVMHTPFSLTGDQVDAGIPVSKNHSTLSDKLTYKNTVNYGQPTAVNEHMSTTVAGKERVLSAPGKAMPPTSAHSADSAASHWAAFKGNVLNIHDAHVSGLDGFYATAQNLNSATWDTLLVYSPMGEMLRTLERQMVQMDKLLQGRQLPAAASKAFQTNMAKVLEELQSLEEKKAYRLARKNGQSDVVAKQAGSAARKTITQDNLVEKVLEDLRMQAYNADQIRLGALALMYYIDQYALEGGEYAITDAQRAEARTRLEQLKEKLAASKELTEVVQRIATHFRMDGKNTGSPTLSPEDLRYAGDQVHEEDEPSPDWAKEGKLMPDATAIEILKEIAETPDISEEEHDSATVAVLMLQSGDVHSVQEALDTADLHTNVTKMLVDIHAAAPVPTWAKLGTPAKAPESWILQMFADAKSATVSAATVIQRLQEYIGGLNESPFRQSQVLLLGQLAKVLPSSLKITMVTPETLHLVKGFPETKAPGWYLADGDTTDTDAIYAMGPQFASSSLSAQMLIHELVHAATLRTMTSADPGIQARVAELNLVLEAAKAKVDELAAAAKAEGRRFVNKSAMFHAVENLDELVAYGLSNQTFQRDVLDRITIQPSTKPKSPLQKAMTGMKAFTELLISLVFRNKALDKKTRDLETNGLAVLLRNASDLLHEMGTRPTAVRAVARRIASMAPESPADTVYSYTGSQILNALGHPSVGMAAPSSVEDSLMRAYSSLEHLVGWMGARTYAKKSEQALSPVDVWQKALDSGEALFASEVAGSPFKTSGQELFAIEQIEVAMQTLLADPEIHSTQVYKELVRLYQEARATLKPSDFEDPKQYDFLFKVPQDKEGRSAFLGRFMAMALAHADVHSKLGYITRQKKESGKKSLLERLSALFEEAMRWLGNTVIHAKPGEPAHARMQSMLERLVDIEGKKRSKLMQASPLAKFSIVEEKATEFVDAMKMGALKLAKSDAVKNANGYVKGAAGVTRIVLQEHGGMLLDAMQQMRDRYMKENQSWITGLLNEVKGVPPTVAALIRMAKKRDQDRQHHIDDMARAARESFLEDGLTNRDDHRQALTKVFLRTGLHTLLEDHDMEYIQSLLEKPEALEAAIRTEIGKLGKHPHLVHYYIHQAKSLGYFKATGRVRSKMLMLNAGNIAKLYGTGRKHRLDADQLAAAQRAIDVLTSLYGLRYAKEADIVRARDVLREEMPRGVHNGVLQMLSLHRSLEQDSRERLFDGSEALMIKGFTSDIINPHTAIEVGYTDQERQLLKEMGYVSVKELERDVDDPDRQQGHLFILKDGGLLPRVTGGILLKDMKSKGTKGGGLPGTNLDLPGLVSARHAEITKRRLAQIDDMFRPAPRWEPTHESHAHMAPILNANGDVVEWRYMMEDSTKENLLEQDSRFEQVLGVMAGSIVDKESTPKQNSNVLRALRDIYEADYATKPHSFVKISADSPEPELREIYRLLPEVTKRELKVVWGKEPFMVPYTMIHPVFGYRKWSLSSAFDKKDRNRAADLRGEARNAADQLSDAEKLLTTVVEHVLAVSARMKGMDAEEAAVYSRRGAVVLRRGEQYWQALVQMTKDIIVVKGVSVLWGNIKDNVGMLLLQGVNPIELIKDHAVAIRGALDFKRDRNELAQLKLRLAAGGYQGFEDEIKAQIAILEDSLARNPVKELIDAGLMPTIAEDVDPMDDMYTYKPKFHRKLEEFAGGLNPTVREVGKWVLMTHDTPLYKGLSQITQISDFVARYVLYKHTTTRANAPMSKADAIDHASDTFVSYDIPMHPGMQYLDDHGFMMFTKYFLRIQRVLIKLTRDNAGRVLAGTLLQRIFHALPMPTHSSIVYKVGNNPATPGAFQLVGASDELATIQALRLLF